MSKTGTWVFYSSFTMIAGSNNDYAGLIHEAVKWDVEFNKGKSKKRKKRKRNRSNK